MPKVEKWEIEKLPTQWLPECRGLGRRVNLNGEEAEVFLRRIIRERGEGTFSVRVSIKIAPDSY